MKFDELVKIADRLRGPNGCDWDKEQTILNFKKFIFDEAQEVIEAIEKDDMKNLEEELGDLMFNIVLVSQIAKEEKHFDINDVIKGIHDKMIRRHPHVFGNSKVKGADAINRQWDEIKKQEKQ